jgi:hypothetical protein
MRLGDLRAKLGARAGSLRLAGKGQCRDYDGRQKCMGEFS